MWERYESSDGPGWKYGDSGLIVYEDCEDHRWWWDIRIGDTETGRIVDGKEDTKFEAQEAGIAFLKSRE